jgi:hypothetical protein
MRRYKNIVIIFNDTGFQKWDKKKIKSRSDTIEAFKLISHNLRVLLGYPSPEECAKLTDAEKHNTFGFSVMDYAWTEQVQDAFWNWPSHAKIKKELDDNKDMSWGLFILNAEPCTIDLDKMTEELCTPKNKISK